MSLVYKNVLSVIASLVILTSCSSKPAPVSEVETAQQKPLNTRELLQYDPKHADKKIDEFMQHLHKVSGFNGNVLVAKKGKIVYENAFGWANYPNMDSLTINSQFELASISKTMTATATLQLMERVNYGLTTLYNAFSLTFPTMG
jgi:CubicO group peptidase (beta-lactamase class C family)